VQTQEHHQPGEARVGYSVLLDHRRDRGVGGRRHRRDPSANRSDTAAQRGVRAQACPCAARTWCML
jgi:hypothetical protein